MVSDTAHPDTIIDRTLGATLITRSVLDQFAGNVRRLAGQGEATLYPYFKQLLEAIFPEDHAVEILQRVPNANVPDVTVRRDTRLVTCVELKPPSVSVDPLPVPDALRFSRYQSELPHIVLTNGWTWLLYVGEVVTCRVDLPVAWLTGSQALTDEQVRDFVLFCDRVLALRPVEARTYEEAVLLLARAARLVEAAILDVIDDLPAQLSEARQSLGALLRTNPADTEELRADRFADAFAQTCVFGYLLARVEAEADITPTTAYAALSAVEHPFLAATLYGITAPEPHLQETLGAVLLTACDAVNASSRKLAGADGSWSKVPYVYEHFFAQYRPADRFEYGVFYTPMEVTRFQVRETQRVLRERHKKTGLTDPTVRFLDPACGTGTYLLALAELAVEEAEVAGQPVPAVLGEMFRDRVVGFEVSPGPATVAQARLIAWLRSRGVSLGARFPVYVVNSLTPPAMATTTSSSNIWMHAIDDEQAAGDLVKGRRRVLVVLGNPPWGRRRRETFELGRQGQSNLLADWAAGASGAAQSVYDLYVAFWRFAATVVLERPDVQEPSGVISFITNRSWLRGKPFTGMRSWLRARGVEIDVVDLGGDVRAGLMPNDEGVFAIQAGCAIATLSFREDASAEEPVSYTRLWGSRAEKLHALVHGLPEPELLQGSGGDPFGRVDWGVLVHAPVITDLFVVDYPGVKTHRDYLVVDVDRAALESGLKTWASMEGPDRVSAFHPTASRQAPAGSVTIDPSLIVSHRFRPLDERFLFADRRFIDRPGRISDYFRNGRRVPTLVFLDSRTGEGPAVIASDSLPGYHSFRGSWGCHVVPLEPTDAMQLEPEALLSPLGEKWATQFGAGSLEVGAYCLAIGNAPNYHVAFSEALESDRVRIPLTTDKDVFAAAVALGTRLMSAWRLQVGTLGSWTQVTTGGPIGHATFEDGTLLFENGDRLDGLHHLTGELSVSSYEVMAGFLADREHLALTVDLSESIRMVAASVAVILDARAESDVVLEAAIASIAVY